MRNPAQNKTTESLHLLLLSPSGKQLITQTTGVNLKASTFHPGVINDLTTLILKPSTYYPHRRLRFKFTPVHPLNSNSIIYVYFYIVVSQFPGCKITRVSGGLDAGANCTIDDRYHFDMFKPFGDCDYPGGTTLSIELEGPERDIIIPYTRKFTLRTYNIINGTRYAVDEGFGVVDQKPLDIGTDNKKHCKTPPPNCLAGYEVKSNGTSCEPAKFVFKKGEKKRKGNSL